MRSIASSKLKKSKKKSVDAQQNTINTRQAETEQETSMNSTAIVVIKRCKFQNPLHFFSFYEKGKRSNPSRPLEKEGAGRAGEGR